MALDKNKALKSLKKKGFVERPYCDHIVLEYWNNQTVIAKTKLSHGSKKDLDAYLIKQMAIQCKLSKNEFADLVNCPLSEERYREILTEKGFMD